jgi:hypothetical protein
MARYLPLNNCRDSVFCATAVFASFAPQLARCICVCMSIQHHATDKEVPRVWFLHGLESNNVPKDHSRSNVRRARFKRQVNNAGLRRSETLDLVISGNENHFHTTMSTPKLQIRFLVIGGGLAGVSRPHVRECKTETHTNSQHSCRSALPLPSQKKATL